MLTPACSMSPHSTCRHPALWKHHLGALEAAESATGCIRPGVAAWRAAAASGAPAALQCLQLRTRARSGCCWPHGLMPCAVCGPHARRVGTGCAARAAPAGWAESSSVVRRRRQLTMAGSGVGRLSDTQQRQHTHMPSGAQSEHDSQLDLLSLLRVSGSWGSHLRRSADQQTGRSAVQQRRGNITAHKWSSASQDAAAHQAWQQAAAAHTHCASHETTAAGGMDHRRHGSQQQQQCHAQQRQRRRLQPRPSGHSRETLHLRALPPWGPQQSSAGGCRPAGMSL